MVSFNDNAYHVYFYMVSFNEVGDRWRISRFWSARWRV